MVAVHPVARQAAHLDDVQDGLAAKFSIPYCVSHALRLRAPAADFGAMARDARAGGAGERVVDGSLPEFGA